MKFLTSITFIAVLIVGSFAAELPVASVTTELPTAKPKPTITTTTTTTTTPAAPETSSKSTVPPTTPTSSTEAPAPITTPTFSSTSSTEAPAAITTPTSSSTSSTQVPTSPAPAPPAPTPAPTPKSPEIGQWALFDTSTNQTCILIQLATQLNITYPTVDNKVGRAIYNIPVNKTKIPNGHCGNGKDDQTIAVEWQIETQNQTNTFALTFTLNQTTHEFSLIDATYQIFGGDLPQGTNATLTFHHVGSVYAAPIDMSYHCTKLQTLNLTASENSTEIIGVASVSHVQLEAYHKGRNAQFSAASDCDAINTPDIVPIAVGISLIALVVIVLVAYVVGRRRVQARGYVSM